MLTTYIRDGNQIWTEPAGRFSVHRAHDGLLYASARGHIGKAGLTDAAATLIWRMFQNDPAEAADLVGVKDDLGQAFVQVWDCIGPCITVSEITVV